VCTLTGTWCIEGDSLFRDYESEHYALDRNSITYAEDKKEEVEDIIAQYEEWVAKRDKTAKQDGRSANTVFIDHSESKIELGKTKVDDEGKEISDNVYLVRKK